MARVELGSVNLLSERVSVQMGTFNPGYPDRRSHRRTLTMSLDFNAADAGQLASDVAAVLAQIRAAEEAARGLDDGSRVAFLWQPDTRDPLWFDLLPDADGSCGSLVLNETATAWMTLGWVQGATLTLNCADYARGPVIVDAVSSTLTNGASLLYRGNVPGDAPALVRLSVTDVSTSSTYLQRLRIGARTSRDHVSGDYDPWIDAAAASGASTVTVAGTVGGSHARRAMTTAWQRVAEFTRPAGWLNVGRFHVVPRIRDNAIRIDAPTGLTALSAMPGLAYVDGVDLISSFSTFQDDSQTTAQARLPRPVPSGALVVVILSADATSVSPTITAPAGFSQAVQRAANAAGWNAIYYKLDAGPGDTVTTWQTNDAGAGLDGIIAAFDGIATASALDKTANATGSSASTSSITQAVELAVALTAHAPDTGASVAEGILQTPWNGYLSWHADFNEGYATNMQLWTRVTERTGSISARVWGGSKNICIATFKALNVTSTAGALPETTLNFCVAAKVGSVIGPASEVASLEIQRLLLQDGGAAKLVWTAPAAGSTPDDYRIFFQVEGGDDWYYVDVGSTATNYVVTSFATATKGDPPSYISTLSDWRLRVGLSSGTVTYPLDSWPSELGAGAWEMPHDPIRGGQTTVTLPPSVALEGSAPSDWLLAVEAKNDSGQTANADVDAAAFLPAEYSILLLEYRDSDGAFGGLAALRTWQYDQRRDGRHSAVLLNAGTEAGQLYHEGWLSVGPGDVTIVALADAGGAVSDVTNAKLTMQVQLTPRYLYLAP